MSSTVLAASLLLAATLIPARLMPETALTTHPVPLVRTGALSALPLTEDVAPADAGGAVTADEREFINRINAERTERGLFALTPDPTLVQAARSHSSDMRACGYFSHVTNVASQRTPMDRYLSALHASGQGVPKYLLVGENIYYCSLSRPRYDVLLGHQALMNSPVHRANILDPRFARVGVGLCRDASGQFWVTEMFLRDSNG